MLTHGEDVEAHALFQRGWMISAIARSLNTRPRQTLNWMTPSQAFAKAVALTA
jgi:IS30 family transposase